MWYITSWAIFAAALAWPVWFTSRQVWRWRRRRSHCESCGYSLHARVSDRCPECGHDVVSPSRLIDPRRMALHTTIVLELLVASHLFYRLEAIQKRGWIAALPTTVLVMFVPLDRADGFTYASASSLSRELAFRWQYLSNFVDSALRVESDGLSYWQRRWLIRRALRVEFGEAVDPSNPLMPAVAILNSAYDDELLTPAERAHVEGVCSVKIITRPQWPLGAAVAAVMDHRSLVFGDGYRLTTRALTPGYQDHVISHRLVDSMIDASGLTGRFLGRFLGRAEKSGPVEYEMIFERYRDLSNTWEEVKREKRVVTTVSESSEHGLVGQELSTAVLETLNPRLGVSPYDSRMKVVWFDVAENEAFNESLGAARFSISVKLYRDGQEFGAGCGTWVSPNQSYRDRLNPFHASLYSAIGNWYVAMEPEASHSKTDVPEDHDWTIVIEGDPHVALRDFESTSYWSGTYEFKNIPVERVESGK